MERLTNSSKEIPTLIDNAEYWLQVYFKLKDYEALEEQGRLIELSCAVGDTVYVILIAPISEKYFIKKAEVKEINIGKYNARKDIQIKVEPVEMRGTIYKYYLSEWGKSIFLTEEEAKRALADMQKG